MIIILMSDNDSAESLGLKKAISDVLKSEVAGLTGDISSFQSENCALKQKIGMLETQIKELKEQLTGMQHPTPQTMEYEYLFQINAADGGFFGRVGIYEDSCYYRMFHKNGDEAEFEYCGKDSEALEKYTAVLDPVCVYEGVPEKSTKIENISPGLIVFDSATNRWKVVRKAFINLS